MNSKSKLRIAFLTSTDPDDKRSWSGTHNRMYTSLKNEFEVVEKIGPVDNLLLKSLGIINKISKIFLNKGYNHNNSILRSVLLSFFLNKRIKSKKFDLIFSPASSTETAFLDNNNIPIVYLSDSSFGQLCGYYDVFSGLMDFSIKESNYIEQKAINKASKFIYPSNWAANFVIQNYGVNKKDVSIIPFGANINEDQIEYIEKNFRKDKEFNLLFLGVNWERKGGPIVLETFLLLLSNGYNVNLTICGCSPSIVHPRINIIHFLNKNNKEDFDNLKNILINSHLLFVPTKADCSPIVFCEANAFGIPVITNDTGGVAEIIINGLNGYALHIDSILSDYYNCISKIIDNEKKYSELSKNSRIKYENELNWEKWGKKMRVIFEKIQ